MDCMKETFAKGALLGGRYETLAPLNNGSFGMVFMARDTTNDETVAIKCLTKKSAADETTWSVSIDEKSEELQCHALLGSHPNIVNLRESFETDSHVFIVLEYCSRGDLYEAIRTGTGPLETEHVRQFMLELVDAVSYIHGKGLYHRDIKPENIFLTDSGAMKLGDFGLATSDTWTFESSVGSDRYMSPEQYDSAGAGYAPEQADIWAVGICLLNILFSRNPFTTPTESDPLFFDFSRDKQSLFDVFPTMSQDTYEIIAQCMSLDPRKRSLAAVRAALERTISFTTCDDSLDDFCSAETRVVPHAKREPLRTPSVQTPLPDTGSFPWDRALHAKTPVPRQLSAIPDTESYKSEDLFDSLDSMRDWFSLGQHTPSMSSMMDSTFGASLRSSIVMRRATKLAASPSLTPISGSLPIALTKPKPVASLASVFGKSEMVSKSWSDLWDEDEEEEQMATLRQAQNARTYSNESRAEDVTLRLDTMKPTSDKVGLDHEVTKIQDVDADMVADGFFFHDTPQPRSPPPPPSPRYSPPPRRSSFDKWSALGERRRAYTGGSDALDKFKMSTSPPVPERRVPPTTAALSLGAGLGIWDHMSNIPAHKVPTTRRDSKRGGLCPWASTGSRVRDSAMSRWESKRGENRGVPEWCGGLHSLHL